MSDRLHLLVYTFDSVSRADAARSALEALDRRLGGARGHVAVVQKRPDGSVILREPRDLREELSSLAAQVAGGITWFVYTFVGLMGPPPAVLAEQLADNAVHQLVRDSGFPDAALHEIGAELSAGSAAVVALLPEAERAAALAELEQLGGRLWEHELPPAVQEGLRALDGPGA
ncbi:MAG: hypothetical protein OHK0015_53490 [Chloroflexi bacterium OHK40]